MTRNSFPLGLLLAALAFSGITSAQGGYDLTWFTIDDGGGNSSGGAFTLDGTAGQPDAGQLSGGSFVLEGGFWSGAVTGSGAATPVLSVEHSGGKVIISWPAGASGFVLEVTDNLSLSAQWIRVGTGGESSVEINPTNQAQFYRLRSR